MTKTAYDFVCRTLSVLQQSTKAVIIKGATSETTTSKGKSDVVWVSCNGYCSFNRNKQQISNGKETRAHGSLSSNKVIQYAIAYTPQSVLPDCFATFFIANHVTHGSIASF